MTFEQWDADKDWWRAGTRETFYEAWCKLAAQNVQTELIGELFDELMGAMRGEYGD